MKRPALFVFIALLFMASSASFALAPKEKLAVGYSSIGGTSIPLWIAQDRGFFERNGLETRLIYIGADASSRKRLRRVKSKLPLWRDLEWSAQTSAG